MLPKVLKKNCSNWQINIMDYLHSSTTCRLTRVTGTASCTSVKTPDTKTNFFHVNKFYSEHINSKRFLDQTDVRKVPETEIFLNIVWWSVVVPSVLLPPVTCCFLGDNWL